MKESKTWLRRCLASVTMVLLIAGVGATGAAASPGPIPHDTVISHSEQTAPVAPQHEEVIHFEGLGCEYFGLSNHTRAQTLLQSGDCNQPVEVRVLACSIDNCFMSTWRSAPDSVRIDAPFGTEIRISYHRACSICQVHEIHH